MSLDYLGRIGKARASVKTIGDSALANVAKGWAEKQTDDLKSQIPKASGSLANSVSFDFEMIEAGFVIKFLADDYWDFVNSGVEGFKQSAGAITNTFGDKYSFKSENPSPSMVQAFGGAANYGKNGEKGDMQNWMASRGIIADDGNYNSLAYAIAKSVKQKGIKPANFYDKVFGDKQIKDFEIKLMNELEKLL